MIVLVMGAAGCGKSTIASLLAERLGCAFLDADQLHDAASKAKMAAGTPLDEDDRRPWLEAIHAVLEQHSLAQQRLVVACSALRRSHRQVLGRNIDELRVVFLDGDPELLARRIRQRHEHFFPAALLADQLAILEPPAGEQALRLDIGDAPQTLIEQILDWLALPPQPLAAQIRQDIGR